MTGTPPRSIAPREATFAEQTRHHIAVRLLPFVSSFTPAQLYLARFFLSAAEAAFFPGVIVYLSHWFIQEDLAKATSNFMAAIPVSPVIGSRVAGWILSHNWFHDRRLALAFLSGRYSRHLVRRRYFFLSDRPGQIRRLANCRSAAMDFAKVGTRKAAKSAINKPRSGTAFSCCRAAGRSGLPSIFPWIHCDVLVADHSETPIRVFKSASRAVRRHALRGGALRDVVKRVAFGQKP